MPFKPGQSKPVGSGRKPGAKKLREFHELLDSPGFSLKREIQAAVLDKDTKLIVALAQMWRAISTTPSNPMPDSANDGPLSDEQLLKIASSGST